MAAAHYYYRAATAAASESVTAGGTGSESAAARPRPATGRCPGPGSGRPGNPAASLKSSCTDSLAASEEICGMESRGTDAGHSAGLNCGPPAGILFKFSLPLPVSLPPG